LKDCIECQEDENKILQQQLESKCEEVKSLQEDKIATRPEGEAKVVEVEQQQQQSDTTLQLRQQIESLEEQLGVVLKEKEDLSASYNGMKQDFILTDFEKTSRIETVESEVARLQKTAEKREVVVREMETRVEKLLQNIEISDKGISTAP
jgi:hypothetical protein